MGAVHKDDRACGCDLMDLHFGQRIDANVTWDGSLASWRPCCCCVTAVSTAWAHCSAPAHTAQRQMALASAVSSSAHG